MFQRNQPPSHAPQGNEPETVIAASVKVEGNFASQGNVLIEGVVEGSLKTERDLRVGERARITADVTAMNAVVAGEIRGNLTVGERLELESGARVQGDIRSKVLVIAQGAIVNGRVTMGGPLAEPETPNPHARGVRTEAAKDEDEDARPEARKSLAQRMMESQPAHHGFAHPPARAEIRAQEQRNDERSRGLRAAAEKLRGPNLTDTIAEAEAIDRSEEAASDDDKVPALVGEGEEKAKTVNPFFR